MLVDATKLIYETFLHQICPPGVALRDGLKGRDDGVSSPSKQRDYDGANAF